MEFVSGISFGGYFAVPGVFLVQAGGTQVTQTAGHLLHAMA